MTEPGAPSSSRSTPPPPHDFGDGPSGAPPRKWDDPPAEDPPSFPPKPKAPLRTVLLVEKTSFPTRTRVPDAHEILQLGFTGCDRHLLCATPQESNHSPQLRLDGTAQVLVFNLPSLDEKDTKARTRGYGLRAVGGFATAPEPGTATVLVAYVRSEKRHNSYDAPAAVEAHDLLSQVRVFREELDVGAPVACRASMKLVVGVSLRDPTRVVVLSRAGFGSGSKWTIARVLAGHMARVTHLALMPREGVVVSADEDGWLRMMDVADGRTLRKVQIETKVPARLLQISADGSVVVTVWGRQVLVWKVNEEDVATFHMEDVRSTEGWPLAISADCRLLASRTEDGVELVDAHTGEFLAEYRMPSHPLVTAAAFNHRGDVLAVGNFEGQVTLLDVVTGND
ncbi:WD40-repeat-containing domain protein [Podospora conica]|nr:WD40-repeat-containing domain protein [Schizothecium conicum]